ncbi:EAL domain-containing protein [Desulfuromonas acetoxidans]|uniref:Diguanylate cyclase/phosphodiesterase with PAS/PAC sensor(S) n=1 Tax=Desulfuromonas acetoxidans (strain DSM 684 / 11070) TaxID=281689 RepID=Q1JWQ1_DESA6|nr:EAL domain-containing protein [Desulfuromonas acetoxidans]EAT14628.1 diguanylate cyclase/phosphodiesterase with PAS/PAC sensor(s) [Desulfuromonas acetoxidans DSM 684]
MTHRTSTKGLWLTLFILWTGLIFYFAWVEYRNQEQLIISMARSETLGSFNKDLLYRRWAAKQGGVYVIVSDYTPPNPYLDHVPNRDVVTTDGKHLTLVNPAYMTRQVHELGAAQYGSKGHITSLNPLRPENVPDDWERACLEQFEVRPNEITSIQFIDEQEHLRMIRPVYTEAMCLKCHGAQGYEEGNIRGGISVSIPLAPYREAQLNLFSKDMSHLFLLWCIGSVVLLVLRFQVQDRLRREDEVKQELGRSEEKYRVLFEESLIGICVADFESAEIVECNNYLAHLVERHPDELIGQPQRILHPDSEIDKSTGVSITFQKHHGEDFGTILNSQLITKNGKLRDVEVQGGVVSFGEKEYQYGLFLDVTERNKYEQQSYRLLQAIDQSPICILMATVDGTPVYVNQDFTRRKGFSLEECKNRLNPINIFIRERVNALGNNDNKYTSTDPWTEERQARTKDGKMYWERISIAPAYDLNQKCSHFVFIGEDITEEKENALHFEYLATHDNLTGLANRLLLHDRLDQLVLKAKRSHSLVFVMLLDLDRFKVINDSLGHDCGDRLLQLVAERLLDAVRESDTVARLGGDEFVVVFQETDSLADALHVAELILQKLSNPFNLDGRQLLVTASAGISYYPDHGISSLELLRHADVAMYKAKETQSDICVFEPSMDQHLLQSMELEADLRQAITRNELQVYYQPKVDASSEKVVGLEALLRWFSPDRGMISPGVFIPLAEQNGMILDIGLWVIEEVCRQLRQWCDQGYSVVPVAVNLSAKQFQSLDLPEQVSTIFDRYQIDSSWFEFELTESMIMQNPVSAIRIMEDLKKLGIRLAVDDFGTGYSSLNYLRRLPLDYLKIDRSFIDDVTMDFSADAVATSIIGIAKSLGMQTIAEGVETSAQLMFLRDNQCDFIQGFYFYKPMPAADISKQLIRC